MQWWGFELKLSDRLLFQLRQLMLRLAEHKNVFMYMYWNLLWSVIQCMFYHNSAFVAW